MSEGAPLVQAVGVSRTYRMGATDVRAVAGIDLTVNQGEVHLFTGTSGSGKSTLIHLLGALDNPSTGKVLFEGRDLADCNDRELAQLRRHRIGFVFQAMNLLPTLTALENVLLPAIPERPTADTIARARDILVRVGLADRVDHSPNRLSGGEQQRVAIARSLLNRPSLILADEPTGELDSQTGGHVIELMRGLAAEWSASLVIVTHDLSIAAEGDRRHTIQDGRLVVV